MDGNGMLNKGTKMYVKEVSAMHLSGAAKSVALAGDKIVAAVAAFGKGQVVAVGDPWLYNEYVDGRKLPYGFQNFEAMSQMVNWTLLKSNANNK
jgi:unsaturated rhamnogalacturonyl hydrolase